MIIQIQKNILVSVLQLFKKQIFNPFLKIPQTKNTKIGSISDTDKINTKIKNSLSISDTDFSTQKLKNQYPTHFPVRTKARPLWGRAAAPRRGAEEVRSTDITLNPTPTI